MSDSDECVEPTYEELRNQPMAEDNQQVVYMNTGDAQQQHYQRLCIENLIQFCNNVGSL